MGYGGIIKKVIRIAIPAIVTYMGGGPLVTAISSAMATGATGGSFREALMSGATSYVGSVVSQGISGRINNANAGTLGTGGNVPLRDASGTLIDVGSGGLDQGLQWSTSSANAGIGPVSTLDNMLANVDKGINRFLPKTKIFGGVIDRGKEIFRSAHETLDKLGGIELISKVPATTLGTLAGAATTMTLNQALLANTQEADDLLLDQGYTPEQITYLKEAAREQMSQKVFDRLITETENPGLGEEEFNKVLAAGIERENQALGPDVTEQQFGQTFDRPELGANILRGEEDLRRATFNQQIGQSFPGDAFKSLDDSIIQSIVDERAEPARQQVGNLVARGNYNLIGGERANEFLSGQEDQARGRVRDVEQSVLGGNRLDVGNIRDTATQQATGYKLGDDLFDVTPFQEQRENLITERQGSLREDIGTSLGNEPLFDLPGALSTGSRAQGVVSGGSPNKSFLDAIAAREGTTRSPTNRRGLGSRGSGAF